MLRDVERYSGMSCREYSESMKQTMITGATTMLAERGRGISLSEASNKFWTLFVTWAFVFKLSEDVGATVESSGYKMYRLASSKRFLALFQELQQLQTDRRPEHKVFRLFFWTNKIQIMFLQFRVCWTKRREHAYINKKSMLHTTTISDFWLASPSQTTEWPCLIPVAFLASAFWTKEFGQVCFCHGHGGIDVKLSETWKVWIGTKRKVMQ